MHEILINAANSRISAFNQIIEGLENQDEELILQANDLLDIGVSIIAL